MVKYMKIKFRRKMVKNQTYLQHSYPPELVEYLGLQAGQEIVLTGEKGKYGKFIAIWVE